MVLPFPRPYEDNCSPFPRPFDGWVTCLQDHLEKLDKSASYKHSINLIFNKYILQHPLHTVMACNGTTTQWEVPQFSFHTPDQVQEWNTALQVSKTHKNSHYRTICRSHHRRPNSLRNCSHSSSTQRQFCHRSTSHSPSNTCRSLHSTRYKIQEKPHTKISPGQSHYI